MSQEKETPIGSVASHVLYTCHGCETTDEVVEVAKRQPAQDIGTWLEGVQQVIAKQHELRHPRCPYNSCDLKIPLGAAEPA